MATTNTVNYEAGTAEASILDAASDRIISAAAVEESDPEQYAKLMAEAADLMALLD